MSSKYSRLVFYISEQSFRDHEITKAVKKKDNNSVSLAGELAVLSQLVLHGDANMTSVARKASIYWYHHPGTKKVYKLEVKTKYRTSSKEVHISRD